jgi:hypothetical protein
LLHQQPGLPRLLQLLYLILQLQESRMVQLRRNKVLLRLLLEQLLLVQQIEHLHPTLQLLQARCA